MATTGCKSDADLMIEKSVYREKIHKLFTHDITGEQIQLLRIIAHYDTKELYAEYCHNVCPQMQYFMPIEQFLATYEQN